MIDGNRETGYLVAAIAAAIAWAAQLPFMRGGVHLPGHLWFVVPLVPGVAFSVLVTLAILRTNIPAGPPIRRYLTGGLVLSIGLPLSLVAGVASLSVDRFLPGDRLHLGRLGLPFVVGEAVSCTVWALVLVLWCYLVYRRTISRTLGLVLGATLASTVASNLVALLIPGLSVLLLASFTVEVCSALLLAGMRREEDGRSLNAGIC